jgi:hypothetical protein
MLHKILVNRNLMQRSDTQVGWYLIKHKDNNFKKWNVFCTATYFGPSKFDRLFSWSALISYENNNDNPKSKT